MRTFLSIALLGVAAASSGGSLKLAWTDCGDSATHGHITSLSPDSVTLGTKTTLTGKGTVDEVIQAASYKISAKAGLIPVFSHNGDACKPDTIKLPLGLGEIDVKGFTCPLSAGAVELDLDLTLSASIPSSMAKLDISLTAAASNGDKALCVDIKTSPASFSMASFPAKEAGEIAAGIVEGFLGADDVKACIQKTVTTIDDVEDAIKDFEKKTASDVLNGLKLLTTALKGLPNDLTACKAVESDVKQIVAALKTMASPMSFVYHVGKDLMVNGVDIYHEIDAAIGDYKAQKWEDFGVNVGTALHKLIIGVTEKFQEFEQQFGKVYSQEERQRRLNIFTQNLLHIKKFQKIEDGTAIYSHLTPFADLTQEEFSARNGFKPAIVQESTIQLAETLDTSALPDGFDWREKGAVNPVKNQQQCGSCWAFATVANIEGAGFVENKKLLSLSEQELVDCDKKTGDQGCQGGLPSNAYKDMIQNKIGLELESSYPYTASDGTCKATASKEKAFIKDWVQISTDEDQIAAALMKYGPLAIGINAGPMQMYHGGIAHPWSIFCNPKSLDHGVAIVGFGVESGKKYWTIRNSWGPNWGEKGYYRIVRGYGACGLNTDVTTATGVTLAGADAVDNLVV